jgi:hypothetical protein
VLPVTSAVLPFNSRSIGDSSGLRLNQIEAGETIASRLCVSERRYAFRLMLQCAHRFNTLAPR